jgi:hypothetical protein
VTRSPSWEPSDVSGASTTSSMAFSQNVISLSLVEALEPWEQAKFIAGEDVRDYVPFSNDDRVRHWSLTKAINDRLVWTLYYAPPEGLKAGKRRADMFGKGLRNHRRAALSELDSESYRGKSR